MKQYVYRSPGYDHGIRILRLKPARNFDAPLHCSLTDARLSDKEHYEALSYVWGAPTGDRQLICDGHLFKFDGSELLITPNCELALRHLRLKWKSRSLWVDAVCIDQKSISDRNHQVNQMGEIYKMAATVLVWLGESDDQTKMAFARWRELENSNKTLEKLSADDRQYLRYICSLPWFRRVWTIQEVALATKCRILCGYESISWDALVLAAKSEQTKRGAVLTWPAKFRTLATRTLSRDYYTNRDPTRASLRIWDILTKCRREEVSDSKDKIFGLFAILDGLGLSIAPPDYSKTPATVYEEITVSFIQQFRHLGLLELAFTFERDPAVPTWVPDFNDRKFFIGVDTRRALPSVLIDSTLLIDRAPGQLLLRGKRIADMELIPNKSNLTFEALTNFRKPKDHQHYEYRLLLPWARVLREWVSLVNESNCPTGRDTPHLFSWLTTKDILEAAADDGIYIPICQELIDNLNLSEAEMIPKDGLERLVECEGLPDTPDGVFLYLIRYILRRNEMGWIASCLDTVCEHTLATLSSGHIGRVPHSTKDDDIVVWFAGAHRPMVIRPAGENYILIGPAYIHGIKEYDVWEDEEDISKLEIFTLQ